MSRRFVLAPSLAALALLGTLWSSFPAPAAAAAAEDQAPAPALVERELYVMGTRARVAVAAADRPAALAAAERAVRALEAAEARLSTWGDTSELARLNRAPVGEPIELSPVLAAELAAADACRRATGGAFDPGVGALVAAWGLRTGGREPSVEELAAARATVGMDGLELADGRAVRRRAGLVLEEGGFGKGAGLDAALAAALAGTNGDVAVEIDLGGQLARRGTGSPALSGALGAAVALADPRDRGRTVALLDVADGSLATSGNGERGIEVDGRRLGHLLDPRTGHPAADFGSLTVWAPTALEADCLATGLYVLGPEAALAWAAERPEVEVVVLAAAADGGPVEALASAGLAERLRALPPAAAITIRSTKNDGSRTLGRLGGIRVPAPDHRDAGGGAATSHPHDS